MIRLPRLRTATAALALATALIAGGSVPASADSGPTPIELLEKCDNGTDSCVFHVNGSPDVFYETTAVVGTWANCTSKSQTGSINWSKTTTSSNSAGISVKYIAGATKAFMVGFKIAYQHEWTESKTDSDTTSIDVPAGHIGRIWHSRQMERVNGQYELHFGKRFYGHYIWYQPFTMTSPKSDGNDSVAAKSTPMTAQERQVYCR